MLFTRDNCSEKEYCFVPKFVDQMTETFLSKIDGISYFGSEIGISGHLLLLNIESKPMFCVVLEGEKLFPNVENIQFLLNFYKFY